MIPLHVTCTAAGGLALLYLFLACLVIRGRWKHRALLLDGGQPEMQRLIRAHANFAEYAPLMLILLALSERIGAPHGFMVAMAAAFALGRVLHAYSLIVHEPRHTGYPVVRSAGMLLTFLPMLAAALYLLDSGL